MKYCYDCGTEYTGDRCSKCGAELYTYVPNSETKKKLKNQKFICTQVCSELGDGAHCIATQKDIDEKFYSGRDYCPCGNEEKWEPHIEETASTEKEDIWKTLIEAAVYDPMELNGKTLEMVVVQDEHITLVGGREITTGKMYIILQTVNTLFAPTKSINKEDDNAGNNKVR